MKEGSYVVIQSWMLTELGLKGNELIVYATVYGFTQDGGHWFYGTKGYLAEWCGATKVTVGSCLKSLVEKGYLERSEQEEHGQVKIRYRATRNCSGEAKNLVPPSKKSLPVNNLTDNTNDNDSNREPTREEVREHVRSKGYRFDPDHFFDYYAASGWRMANGQRVKSWKQCCVTWEHRTKEDDGVKQYLRGYDFGGDEGGGDTAEVHGRGAEARPHEGSLPLW